MAPSAREGVYDRILLDRRSGLPRLKDVVAVQADSRNAADFVEDVEARLEAGRAVSGRARAKLAYYRRLLELELPPLHALQVRLRRVIPQRKAAAFEAVFDRHDPAEGVFVRYTLLLEQIDSEWGSSLLERRGDYSSQTAAFRELMEKAAQDESEIMFLILGKKEGVRLEEVTRGRIGPLWSPWTPAPPGWMPGKGGSYVLHCPLDRASIADDKDADNDPFSDFYRDFLSKDSRSVVDEAARQLGYRVRKERKFVCTRDAEAPLRGRLKRAGTRNMVYTI